MLRCREPLSDCGHERSGMIPDRIDRPPPTEAALGTKANPRFALMPTTLGHGYGYGYGHRHGHGYCYGDAAPSSIAPASATAIPNACSRVARWRATAPPSATVAIGYSEAIAETMLSAPPREAAV